MAAGLSRPKGVPAPDRDAMKARLLRNRQQGQAPSPARLAAVPDTPAPEEAAPEAVEQSVTAVDTQHAGSSDTAVDVAAKHLDVRESRHAGGLDTAFGSEIAAEESVSASPLRDHADATASLAHTPPTPAESLAAVPVPQAIVSPPSLAAGEGSAFLGRPLAVEFGRMEKLQQRSVSYSKAAERAVRRWERARRAERRGGRLGPSALFAAACRDLPTDLSGALDLVGVTPDAAFDGGRFQATVNLPVDVIERIEELAWNMRAEGMLLKLPPWQVVAAAINRQLDAEGGYGFGKLSR